MFRWFLDMRIDQRAFDAATFTNERLVVLRSSGERRPHGFVQTITRHFETPAAVSSARTTDGLLSGGRVGESRGVAEADVDGQVGEDTRHLGSVAELHGAAGAGTVERAGRVRRHDTR